MTTTQLKDFNLMKYKLDGSMSPKPESYTNSTLPMLHISETTLNDTDVNSIHDRHVCKLEHSFSQSELDHFKDRASNINALQSDFVHLHGIKNHPSKCHNHLDPRSHNESKAGFRFRSIRANTEESTKIVVVVPSIDLDRAELVRLSDSIDFYEERQLYHLILANDPSVRIIYLSSNLVDEKVFRYYLHLGLRHDKTHSTEETLREMRKMVSRIMLIHVPSSECIPLSEKILKSKQMVELLKGLICSSFNGCGEKGASNPSVGLSVFTGSDLIDNLSKDILGIRVLEASGDQLHYGTKQGSREIFGACGLNFPKGTPNLPMDNDLLSYGTKYGGKDAFWSDNHCYIRSARELSIGIARQIALGVEPKKWMIKLNQGFSGKGNASIDLLKIQSQSKTLSIPEMAFLIEQELPSAIKFEDPKMSWYNDDKNVGFSTQIERLGVIAEQFIEGEVPTSPSVQAVIEPRENRVSIISTHEQLLDGQVYHGCINPASNAYRSKIMEMGLNVGKYMAARGVVGHFSVDFIANHSCDGSFDVNAVEVNLRQGGTTHPHAMMALLCGGCICRDGLFRTNDGEVRTYIATDMHYTAKLKGYDEGDLVDAIECKNNPLANKIRWNKAEGIGVTFHLFKFVKKYGRVGFTAIGRTKEEVRALYDATVRFLEDVGEHNIQERTLLNVTTVL